MSSPLGTWGFWSAAASPPLLALILTTAGLLVSGSVGGGLWPGHGVWGWGSLYTRGMACAQMTAKHPARGGFLKESAQRPS